MKLAELQQQCRELGLEVTGRRKAPYQEALNKWLEQHGSASADVPQIAIKVC